MVKVHLNGQMEENILEVGKMEKLQEKVCSTSTIILLNN